jgi:ribonuclease Z
MNNHNWNNVFKCDKIPNTQLTLRGASVAAEQTGFYVKEIGVFLDAGITCDFIPKIICITHLHLDHYKGLSSILCTSSPLIIVPSADDVEKVKKYISLCDEMSRKKAEEYTNIMSLSDGQEHELTINKKKWIIEGIKCHHQIPCIGFGFSEIRPKLKPEFTGLTQPEYVELIKNNITITDNYQAYQFCFLGDTSHKVLNNNILEKYPTIIIECTFLLQCD